MEENNGNYDQQPQIKEGVIDIDEIKYWRTAMTVTKIYNIKNNYISEQMVVGHINRMYKRRKVELVSTI